MALLLSIGSEPELLLLRTHVLEKSGHSVVTVSDVDYAVAVFNSARFDGVIFCHVIPAKVRTKLVDEMMSTVHRNVPSFVFRRPLAPGGDAALTVVGNKTPRAAALCKELIGSFSFSRDDVKKHSLQSWKEIALYVGRGVRTVQRWEQLGLPVHRPSSGARSAVFALVSEVDEWMKGADRKIDPEARNSPSKMAQVDAPVLSDRPAAP